MHTFRLRHISLIILTIAGFFALAFFFFSLRILGAPEYSFSQSSWTGGIITTQAGCTTVQGLWVESQSKCYATHTTNQTGWTSYDSKDANIDTTVAPQLLRSSN